MTRWLGIDNFQKLLTKEDLIRNGSDSSQTQINRISHYFTGCEVFGVNNLSINRLQDLKKCLNIYNSLEAIVMFVSLSSFNQFIRLFVLSNEDRHDAELIPYSPKKVYRNVMHQQLQVWSDMCYLCKHKKIKHKQEHKSNTKLFLILTNKHLFAKKLNGKHSNKIGNSIEICFGNKNKDWSDIVNCGDILNQSKKQYATLIQTAKISNKDIDSDGNNHKKEFLVSEIKRIWYSLSKSIYSQHFYETAQVAQEFDHLSLSKLKMKYFECIYLDNFVNCFFKAENSDNDTRFNLVQSPKVSP